MCIFIKWYTIKRQTRTFILWCKIFCPIFLMVIANGNIMVMNHYLKKNQLINGNGNGKVLKFNGNEPLGQIFTITQA